MLANAGVEISRRHATAYVGEFGRAESGVELVAGRPSVNQRRVAYEAHVDTVVMTRARISAGMSPEEAWRVQSAIAYGKLGRGPVYSADTVEFRSHNHCGCRAELVLHEWEPTDEEALYRASYMQAAVDAEEEFGRSWARTAAGENQILVRMRRNNPGLFNDGVFAKDLEFRSPAWVKAREANQRKRDAIRLARATGGSGGGGGKPPRGRNALEAGDPSGDRVLVQALRKSENAELVQVRPDKSRKDFGPPVLATIESARSAPQDNRWEFLDEDSKVVAIELENRLVFAYVR